MEQFQGRPYQNFASPISSAGEVMLQYTGTYNNPGYHPGGSGKVHGYDIGGTLAGAKGRDDAIRQILGLDPKADVKKVLFTDDDMTVQISQAQEVGLKKGAFSVNSLDGVVSQLAKEMANDEDAVAITVGTYQMARSFLHSGRLEDYITALVTSEEAGTGNKKTVGIFLETYVALRSKGRVMVDYCDDSVKDAQAAVEASRIVENKYGVGYIVYLVKSDATDEELGMHDDGYVIIRDISDKGKYDEKVSGEGEQPTEEGDPDAEVAESSN